MLELISKRKNYLIPILLSSLLFATSLWAQEGFFPFENKKSKVWGRASLESLNTNPGAPNNLSVEVSIPPRHHAYLDKGEKGFYIPVRLDFSALMSEGYEITPVSSPEGEKDAEFGATVLRGMGRYQLNISRKGGIDFESLPKFKISYQICNDETKICYPPGSVNVSFDQPPSLPTKTTATKTAPVEKEDEGASMGISEVVSEKFKEYSKSFSLSFLLILAAGLLAAGTPCVYPMLPITCAILMERGKGSRRAGRYHTFTYFAGIVFVYILLGYLAGMTGGAFNTFMRSAFVNLFFSSVFILFGLAMLGFFNMSVGENFIAGLSSAAGKKESLSGTFFMGLTAGLIISPCVGPVVFTLLMSVADRIAEANALALAAGKELSYLNRMVIAGKGGILMGGFGIGIGIPFLLVGFFSNKMPRSGTWMNYIKYIFGVIIFYVAWIYYMKGMHTAKIPENSAYAIMAAIVFLVLAIKTGVFRTEKSRYKKALSFVLLALSVAAGYHGVLKSDIQSPPATAKQTSEYFESHGNLRWHRDYEKAKEMAIATSTPMFIDFYADWCANCVEFGKISLADKKLNAALSKITLVKIYDTDPVFAIFQNKREHRELKTGLPYFALLAPDETLLWKGTQYDAVDTMVSRINKALSP